MSKESFMSIRTKGQKKKAEAMLLKSDCLERKKEAWSAEEAWKINWSLQIYNCK